MSTTETARVLNVSRDDYHNDRIGDTPTLSASIAAVLTAKSPAHAWAAHPRLNPAYERETEEKFDIGTHAHSLLLEGIDKARALEFTDWRTGAAKAERDACRAAGFVPLLRPQYDRCVAMVESVKRQLDAFDIDPRPFVDGVPEVALAWETDGVKCRALIDWLTLTGPFPGEYDTAIVFDTATVFDLKTTSVSANPNAWAKTAAGMNVEVQIAFHSMGVEAVYGVRPQWRYVVVETSPPYAVSVLEPSAVMLALGEDKVRVALNAWRSCLATDVWPAYENTAVRIDPPVWHVNAWLDNPLSEGELDIAGGDDHQW